jgi:thiosulfate/3-mercaptopyruvate sulfurtransferase
MGLPETIPSLLAAKNLKSLIALSSQFYDKFRIVEANVGKDALEIYNRGHIDRAVYFDTMECVQTTPLLPRNVPNRECFKDYVGSLGISNKHHLIFYDRSPFGFYASPRLWWLFKVQC